MTTVLHLRCGTTLYGAERALLALSTATPAPYVPIVGSITPPGQSSALVREATHLGLAALHFESAVRVDVSCARRVAAAVRLKHAKLMHAHDPKSLLLAAMASAFTRIPLVATFHGDTRANLRLRAHEALARVLANSTRGVVAVSAPLERQLRRWVLAAPVYLVPNGLAQWLPITAPERLAARQTLGAPGDEPLISVIGRLSEEKGHRVLLDALVRLQRPPRTLFAGDGPLRRWLQARAAGLPVQFLGYLPDTRAVYAASDLIVIPSLTEGLPLVALEALSSGVCVLASAVGGLVELLAGDAGHLVPAADPGALAHALRWLCEDRGARQAAAERGRRAVARYSVGKLADSYARTVYARALSSMAE